MTYSYRQSKAAAQLARAGSKVKATSRVRVGRGVDSGKRDVTDERQEMKSNGKGKKATVSQPTESFIDCARQIQKVCDGSLTARGCLRMIKGWSTPDGRNQ